MIRRSRPAMPLLRRLRRDRDGVTLVEFAIVGPVLILMIMGLFDIAHSQYTSSVLYGAMQKAGRDLTIETASAQESNIDTRLREQVASVMPNGAQVTIEKLSHFDFADVGMAEDYTDQNGDRVCNANEPYVDSNNNSRWDANRGRSGIGGARDVVMYSATVTYRRMFPLYGMIGLPQNMTMRASTVLRNQPFDQQGERVTTVRNCT